MCNPAEQSYITILPPYEDIDEERFHPFPPPLSPVATRLPGQRTRSLTSAGDQREGGELKVGGLLFTQMEEEPMVLQTDKPTALDIEKLLSEEGLPAFCSITQSLNLKGEDHEADDLHMLLEATKHWAQKLYPDQKFEDLVTLFAEIGNCSVIQSFLGRLEHPIKAESTQYVDCDNTGETEMFMSRHTVFKQQEMFGEDSGILVLLHTKHDPREKTETLCETSP